ncbi:selenocysteine lyase/cysteine desulfurase [Nonomuraea polychroma]|uniref:Selenocysteine lyase/cysteine desulfurase n=1 Tax=Nonomuraea polychroma TaxID=46176 RepID=A0A438M1S1_9ACTN|nr:aminotransferase class V-fold PLP-dependent enzyme [Nonomuraea polychroma]RVX39774.1 selenocysteine lyase/cysteine desulfurase [Nonomuraea polychroma]
MADQEIQSNPLDYASAGLGRRAVLMAGVAAMSAGCAGEATRRAPGPAFDPRNWGSVRAQFSLTSRYAHFAAFMLAAHPAPVRDAITQYRDALDSRPQDYGIGFYDLERSDDTRKAIAGYIGAQPQEVALTDSTTMGLGLVYGGLRLKAGEEVITTEHDFYSCHEALRLRAETDGIVIHRVRLYENPATASADEIVNRLVRRITPRTRVLALTWVHSSTGVKLPLSQISQAVKEINARRGPSRRVLIVVDGVHGFAAENASMSDLGADVFITATHKWLFGPRGTGFVWARTDAWPLLRPVIPSFSRQAWTGTPGPPADLNTPGGYHSFENRWAVPQAVAFHESIGKAAVAERIRSQAVQLKEGLAKLPNVRLVTPTSPELSAGVICCAVNGMEPDAVVQRLLTKHAISAGSTPYRESFVRFGPSIVTSPDEVERVIKAMASMR